MGLFDFLKKDEYEKIKQLEIQLEKYKPIINVERELIQKQNEFSQFIAQKQLEMKTFDVNLDKLKNEYRQAHETYTKLKQEISIFENKFDLIEFGIYEPVYDFEKSEEYRIEQNKIIQQQKKLIVSGEAAICSIAWTIEGSRTQGQASTDRFIKLVLRTFNGECDSFIAKVKWNNVNQMKERIKKSYESINKIGESQGVNIKPEYLDLKLKEMQLEYEYQLKKQKEKEELKEAQAALREEEKARREYEQAQKMAEKEEAMYQKALDKARMELGGTTGETHDILQMQIEKLELELKEAQEKKERALSMAQQTKRGHVYIISNIGSFGERVFKIGMTRRLDPLDRIRELGDASVPFQFDVHAMIFSEDAPTLEYELHKHFTNNKVNMLNYRKEFFNASIDEIEQKLKEICTDIDFCRIPEAIEYRETLAILEKLKLQSETKIIESDFPLTLDI